MKLKISIQKRFFLLYFSNVHISTNIVLQYIKSLVAVGEIHVEGAVSQSFVLSLSFHFMQKNGELYIYIFEYFFLNFIEKELGPLSKI